MTGMLFALLAGLAAGAVHVLTGPDHLAAVLPLAARSRQTGERRGLWVGTLWGLGHASGVVILGGLGALLRSMVEVNVDAVSAVAEVVVGVALVFLGGWALKLSRTVVIHAHEHQHAEEHHEHAHVHVHVGDQTTGTSRHVTEGDHGQHRHGAFAFGLLHGFAGTGHLVGALPALALGGLEAASYIGGYLLAAVPLMALVGGAVVRFMDRPSRVKPAMQLSGAVAMVVGVVWIGVAVMG